MSLSRPIGASRRAPSIKPVRKQAKPGRRVARVQALRPPRAAFNRRSALSRVLALWPSELDDVSADGRRNVVAKLRCALRAERRRGIAGHWTYDLARHVELLHLYRQELASLKAAAPAMKDTRPLLPRTG